MPEEDLVTLLTNPLDNAIEACASADKTIQFKMVIEEDQLVLSVRNPVSSPVFIKDNTIVTSKRTPPITESGCPMSMLLSENTMEPVS